jgi:hypothetical protein
MGALAVAKAVSVACLVISLSEAQILTYTRTTTITIWPVSHTSEPTHTHDTGAKVMNVR